MGFPFCLHCHLFAGAGRDPQVARAGVRVQAQVVAGERVAPAEGGESHVDIFQGYLSGRVRVGCAK